MLTPHAQRTLTPGRLRPHLVPCVATIALTLTAGVSASPGSDDGRDVRLHGGVQTADGKNLFGDPLDISLKEKRKARDVAEGLALLTGYNFNPGRCGDYELGPLDDGIRRTGKEFWIALIAPYTKTVRITEHLADRPAVTANLRYGETLHDFDIERGPRIQVLGEISRQLGQQLSMNPHEGVAGEMEGDVGPIRGRMSVNEALRAVIGDEDFMIRWGDGGTWVSIEPATVEKVYADMSESECSMGLPELPRITVTESRLPSLEGVPAPVEVFDRERIERSGAASIPELLRYATQTAFTRAPGYRPNGAQYAEGRGVGPAMVLIEGQRTMASIGSLQDAAFDLNTIPLSAVESVELVPDSGSLVHGVDALGGIVNIVLRKPTQPLSVESRYGTAQGGAIERRLTALARTENSSFDGVIIADQSEVTNLLGHERSRYANQNYTRYPGGIDRRSLTSEQGNLQIAGSVLGLPSPNGGDTFDAGDLSESPNFTSLARYQSVSPSRRRASLVASAATSYRTVDVSGNAIYSRQDTGYTVPPPTVIGALVSSEHPQNFLHQPFLYFGLLSGLPSQAFEASTEHFRAGAVLTARAAGWTWQLSMAHTQETYTSVLTNAVDPIALTASLNTADPAKALRFFQYRPGEGRADLLAPPRPERYSARSSQAHINGETGFELLPVGDVIVQIGAEWRNESIDFIGVDPNAARDAVGSYAGVRIPILAPVVLSAGIRRDSYSDGDSIVTNQLGFEWMPAASLKMQGYLGERYRQPSLFELHASSFPLDIPVTDPKTGETAIATVVQGSSPDLKPTTATSSGFGAVFRTTSDLEVSLSYWQLRLRDRINVLPLQTTLEYEDVLPGRVIRDPPTSATSPGQIRLIDIGWRNLGEIEVAGVDVEVRKKFPAWGGTLSAEAGLTWNTRYRFRDLPAAVSPMTDRVGVASESGTILRHRAVSEITWENDAWRLVANVLEQPHYRDIRIGDRAPADVSSQMLLDFSVSRRLGSSSLTIGVVNAFDSEPGYSNASVWGYDTSQGDMRGRFMYGEVRLGF